MDHKFSDYGIYNLIWSSLDGGERGNQYVRDLEYGEDCESLLLHLTTGQTYEISIKEVKK